MLYNMFILVFYLGGFLGLLFIVSFILSVAECEEDKPIADSVRQVKIKSDDWISQYFAGEFYPDESDEKKG